MKNIVILISGTGSNMAAIVQAARQQKWSERLGARVAAVISNRPDAKGLLFAREQGIATAVVDHTAHASREAFDAALAHPERLGQGQGDRQGKQNPHPGLQRTC